MIAAPAAGAVRIRTAPVGARSDLDGTLRALTLAALEPPLDAARTELVHVDTRTRPITVTLLEPLATFARLHGCRSVAAHGHRHDGVEVATVVLTRHPQPVGA